MNKKDSDNMGVKRTRNSGTQHMTKEERSSYAIETTKQAALGKKNQNNALQKSDYLDRPETREFHKIIRRKAMAPNRTCLDSPENMSNEILEYFELCDEYNCVPVVVGLANYLGLTTSYMYQIANSGSELSPPLKKGIDFIHELLESASLKNAVNPVSFIFSAKNWFGMQDGQTITLKPDNSSSDRSQTMEALQEVIEEQKLLENNQK